MSRILCRWERGVFVPLPPYLPACQRRYVDGEVYRLEASQERSDVSHRHYFAQLHEYWLKLPEPMADRFPTDEHLRKWALIKAGYRCERTIVAESESQAAEIAALAGELDEYAVVVVRGTAVIVMTAKSQSRAAMSRQEFQESKQAVLDVCARLVGRVIEEREAA
jgi:hypothetical protein